jgi:AcrR family transcriptional regulator
LTTVAAFDIALCDFTVSAYIGPMASPRSFDPNEALDLARDVFWRKGFQGTSLDDITAATGLAKPSLYAAFGDKNALFLKVLDRYHERIVANAERVLMEGPSARDAIERWLAGFVPFCSGAKGTHALNPPLCTMQYTTGRNDHAGDPDRSIRESS